MQGDRDSRIALKSIAANLVRFVLYLCAWGFLASLSSFAPPIAAQQATSSSSILDARDISEGCCDSHYNRTYLRVFADGRAEWEAFDEQEKAFIVHQGILPKKKLKAIQWAVDNMRGLEKRYDGKAGENNIDSWYRFAITGKREDKTYHTDIIFGLPVTGKNYSGLPGSLRTVVCNFAMTRSELANETADLEFCRKYYVGW